MLLEPGIADNNSVLYKLRDVKWRFAMVVTIDPGREVQHMRDWACLHAIEGFDSDGLRYRDRFDLVSLGYQTGQLGVDIASASSGASVHQGVFSDFQALAYLDRVSEPCPFCEEVV